MLISASHDHAVLTASASSLLKCTAVATLASTTAFRSPPLCLGRIFWRSKVQHAVEHHARAWPHIQTNSIARIRGSSSTGAYLSGTPRSWRRQRRASLTEVSACPRSSDSVGPEGARETEYHDTWAAGWGLGYRKGGSGWSA